MDNLVLQTLTRELSRLAVGAVADRIAADAPDRVRVVLASGGEPVHLTLCWRHASPWVGIAPPRRRRLPPQPWLAPLRRTLEGQRLTAIDKVPADRRLALRFASGRVLLLEALPGRALLVSLDADGIVETLVGAGPAARRRLVAGDPYVGPESPAGAIDPFAASADAIGRHLGRLGVDGSAAVRDWSRALPGIGRAAAALLRDEAGAASADAGDIVRRRLDALLAGTSEPWVEAPVDPRAVDPGAGIEPDDLKLHPWLPHRAAPGPPFYREDGPARTAGLYHTLLDAWRERVEHGSSLAAILDRERRRLAAAAVRAAGDLERFADPDRFRRWGEALLAGLTVARRVGEQVFVPDPYEPAAGDLAVPAPPGVPLPEVAERHFAAHRRARRGRERARTRLVALESRSSRLDALAAGFAPPGSRDEQEALAAAMRREGIAVGIAAGTRAAREVARGSAPRLEGVRIFESAEGWTVLVGKSGRDNHRLTFKLAGPDDFWLHALGVPGAHVVVRNPDRVAAPPAGTLSAAAAAAAWFSEARRQPWADVQWTRRKNVRRPRGAPPGTVTVKRFRTIRVKPSIPGPLGPGLGQNRSA